MGGRRVPPNYLVCGVLFVGLLWCSSGTSAGSTAGALTLGPCHDNSSCPIENSYCNPSRHYYNLEKYTAPSALQSQQRFWCECQPGYIARTYGSSHFCEVVGSERRREGVVQETTESSCFPKRVRRKRYAQTQCGGICGPGYIISANGTKCLPVVNDLGTSACEEDSQCQRGLPGGMSRCGAAAYLTVVGGFQGPPRVCQCVQGATAGPGEHTCRQQGSGVVVTPGPRVIGGGGPVAQPGYGGYGIPDCNRCNSQCNSYQHWGYHSLCQPSPCYCHYACNGYYDQYPCQTTTVRPTWPTPPPTYPTPPPTYPTPPPTYPTPPPTYPTPPPTWWTYPTTPPTYPTPPPTYPTPPPTWWTYPTQPPTYPTPPPTYPTPPPTQWTWPTTRWTWPTTRPTVPITLPTVPPTNPNWNYCCCGCPNPSYLQCPPMPCTQQTVTVPQCTTTNCIQPQPQPQPCTTVNCVQPQPCTTTNCIQPQPQPCTTANCLPVQSQYPQVQYSQTQNTPSQTQYYPYSQQYTYQG